jgi:hypothetical protein
MQCCTCRERCWPGKQLNPRTFRNHKRYRDYDVAHPGWWIPPLEPDTEQNMAGDGYEQDQVVEDVLVDQVSV